MLVLARVVGESIVIGQDVTVTVVGVCGQEVRLAVDAPTAVPVHRREVFDSMSRESGGRPVAPLSGSARRKASNTLRRTLNRKSYT